MGDIEEIERRMNTSHRFQTICPSFSLILLPPLSPPPSLLPIHAHMLNQLLYLFRWQTIATTLPDPYSFDFFFASFISIHDTTVGR